MYHLSSEGISVRDRQFYELNSPDLKTSFISKGLVD